MSNEIFRKVALERLSTPEQLDQALLLAPSGGRMALYATVFAVLLMLLASVLISVPLMVSGVGMVVQGEGVAQVVAANDGRVLRLLVKPGQQIAPGQELAQLAQPQQEAALQTLLREIDDLQARRSRILAMQQQQYAQQTLHYRQQRAQLDELASAARLRLAWLQKELDAQTATDISQRQAITAERLLLHDKLATLSSQNSTLENQQAQARYQREREALELEAQLNTLVYRSQEWRQRLARESVLRSEVGGVIAEINIGSGDMLRAGQSVLSVLPAAAKAGAPLQVVAYLPSGEAKKVRPGMAIRVTPDHIKKEEFGAIIGTVLAVAPLPATPEGMQRTLHNRQLVQGFVQSLSPHAGLTEVRMALTADAASPSGLRWTSRGPQQKLEAGTTVQAQVVVARMRLLALALPALQNWLQLEPAT